MSSPFTPEELAYMEAHRDASRVHEIHWVYSVPIACAVLSTALRLLAKRLGHNAIALDDCLIVIATICLVGECASGLAFGPPYGMGRHVITVTPHDAMMVRKGDYVFSHFYDIALVTVKLGILAFYHRVFVVPLFRKIVLGTAAFVIAWGVGITVTLALACRPIERYWDDAVKGDCLNLVNFTYFTNITNLITDIWIFLMPIPVIWHLQLQTKRKLLLCFIFSIGLATCIVSSIRLTVVLGHGYPDFTWSYVPLGAYSAFEPLGGILCTNLPIIWHMWRKRRSVAQKSNSNSSYKTNQSPTASPGSRESRRSRFVRSLGLSNIDQSQVDNQSRTILEDEEAVWKPEMQDRPVTSNRDLFFDKVERVRAETDEVEGSEASTIDGASLGKSRTGGSNGPPPASPEGMRKNVWEVRKKRGPL